LQLVTDNEYSAHVSTESCCNTESGSRNYSSTEDNETLGKVFVQPCDVPDTRDEHIACSIQTCATNNRIQQQNNVVLMTDAQHRSLSEIIVNEGLKNENHSRARPTTELFEILKTTKDIWSCSSCTFINTVTANICEMCFSSR